MADAVAVQVARQMGPKEQPPRFDKLGTVQARRPIAGGGDDNSMFGVNPPANPDPTTAPTQLGPPTYASFAEYLAANPGQVDAWEYLDSILKEYGLGSLTEFAQEQIKFGRSDNEILQRLRETDTYKTRFSAIVEMKKKGLPAISEAEVLAYEKQATQVLQSWGLPSGFYDQPEDFAKFMVNGVSVAEVERRVTNIYGEVSKRQDLVQEWGRLGYGMGDLVAHVLDPDKTEEVLTRRLVATQRSAEAKRAGFGELSTGQAEDLANLGVTQQQSEQGFNDLTRQRELFQDLPGQNEDKVTQDQQLAAAFRNDVGAQQTIEKKAKTRVATFAGGGSFTQSQDGTTGLGSAR